MVLLALKYVKRERNRSIRKIIPIKEKKITAFMVRTIASKQMSMMEKTIKMVAKDAKNDRKEITEDSLITIRKIPFFDIPMELSIPST